MSLLLLLLLPLQVDRAVTDLASPKYVTRAAAQRTLTGYGELARAQVTAATRSKDPEVRFRARQILCDWRNVRRERLEADGYMWADSAPWCPRPCFSRWAKYPPPGQSYLFCWPFPDEWFEDDGR